MSSLASADRPMKLKCKLRIFLLLITIIGGMFGIRLYLEQRSQGLSPVIDYEAIIDLGERERGEIVVAHLPISNSGRSELVVNEFRTTCACAGVEREIDGRFFRIESVIIAPGEQAEIVIRMAVDPRSGGSQRALVFFRCNDPVRPGGAIEVLIPKVKGGVLASPTAVLLGVIPVGRTVRQSIDVYDGRITGRRIKDVVSTQPTRFRVRQVPLQDEEKQQIHEEWGTLIGRVEVTALAETAGTLSGEIEIHLAGENRPPDKVSVSGQAVGPVVVSPDSLVLPRHIGDRLEYTGKIMVRGRTGLPVTVSTESAPAELSVEVEPAGAVTELRIVNVTWRSPRRILDSSTKRVQFQLRINSGDSDDIHSIQVVLSREGE